jgi:DNA primase
VEIQAIKERLSMAVVLAHYGLHPDKHQRLHCPFHPDKTPSLQIYSTTNTYCCFSSNCSAGTGDVIQFIELMEKCTKHEAIVKAAALAGMQEGSSDLPGRTDKLVAGESSLDKIAVFTKLFSYYKKGLPSSTRAVQYVERRSLNYRLHELGYNSGGLHIESKNHHLTQSMVTYGLLKPRPAGGYSVWAKDCIVFPLKNGGNKIVSLYGRSITNDSDQRHFYLADRAGLYPGYPKATTTKLILVESIIDAASLLEQKAITEQYAILSLYGTNGFTQEHTQAILALTQLEEVILMLNGDDAGMAATNKHAQTLHQLLPEIRIMQVHLPAGEDVNSLLQSHEDPAVLADLISERTDFLFSIEKKKDTAESSELKLTASNRLNTSNPELLRYDDEELYIEILGGIKITGLDRMKVTLKVWHKERLHPPEWYSIDLYHQAQREQTTQHIAERFECSMQSATNTIIQLITELESYRLQKIESLQPKQESIQELTAGQRQQAIAELQKPNLLQRTTEMIRQSGIVGEATNSLIAYLAYSTRKQPVPLHVMFLGSSGSGKTYLQEKLSELIPSEDKLEITQITENALYYFKQQELAHRLLLIEDLDGAAGVFYPLRELQTKRRISKTVTLKDSKGNLKTITLTVEGPVCVSGCTTKEKLYEDNANRCILLYTDQSGEQDKRINDYQTKIAAGAINKEREQQYKSLFQNMQRVLQPVTIVNPYAPYIQLPEQVFKPRRTMTLLLGFIEAVTFYHQYQREVKKDSSGQQYIETTISDIEAAFTLLKEVLFSKSDELTKATRDFLEQLKVLLKESGAASFSTKSIREQLRINPGNMKRYLSELVRYGYIKGSGNRYRSYEYQITYPGEYEQLKSSIDEQLQTILRQIKGSSSVVQ